MKMDGFNLDELKRISGGDPAFIRDMVELFITQTENSIVEMDNCFDTNDLGRIFKVIHKMKPSVLIMGMDPVYARILEIEKMKEGDLNFEKLKKDTDILKDQLRFILVDMKKL